MRGVLLAVMAFCAFTAGAAAPGAGAEVKPVEVIGLRSIAGWLKKHGTDGYLGADVADALGITRRVGEEQLDAKSRGYRNDKVLRIAQLLTDDQVLFMVQGGDGEVYFYLCSVREGLRKALVSIPGRSVVAPLDALEAESNFRAEVLYWEDKVQP
jgi:hypothetical protein